MNITRRSLVSDEEVTAKLDALARRYHLPASRYDKSIASKMSEFDALKWMSLCSKLDVLRRRRYASQIQIPSQFLDIYGCESSERLENTCESLTELAA